MSLIDSGGYCGLCGEWVYSFVWHYCTGPKYPQPIVLTGVGARPTVEAPRARPTKEQTFMRVAQVFAERGTCERLRVGAVVTSKDLSTVYSMGYNGRQRGAPNECERPEEKGNCGCLHAEENALLKAPYGPDLVMFVTHLPCVQCAKRICNSSVYKVYYGEDYTYQETRDILAAAGIPLIQVEL